MSNKHDNVNLCCKLVYSVEKGWKYTSNSFCSPTNPQTRRKKKLIKLKIKELKDNRMLLSEQLK